MVSLHHDAQHSSTGNSSRHSHQSHSKVVPLSNFFILQFLVCLIALTPAFTPGWETNWCGSITSIPTQYRQLVASTWARSSPSEINPWYGIRISISWGVVLSALATDAPNDAEVDVREGRHDVSDKHEDVNDVVHDEHGVIEGAHATYGYGGVGYTSSFGGQGGGRRRRVSATRLQQHRQQKAKQKVYLVTLRDLPPTALYTKGLSMASASSATNLDTAMSDSGSGGQESGLKAEKLNYRSATAFSYASYLKQSHNRVLSASGIALERKLYSYTFAANAMAVVLSPLEAEEILSHPKVGTVEETSVVKLLTVNTPNFLGLAGKTWQSLGTPTRAGEGVVVGVIDSGFWPESPAFSDKVTPAFGPPPPKWRGGNCTKSKSFAGCTKKVLGAYSFFSGFQQMAFGGVDLTMDYLSPRDVVGHGSHTSSTAAGNSGVTVDWGGARFGAASGMAPRARLAIYKVFWRSIDPRYDVGADVSDILAAIDRATSHGVDVINFSAGSAGGGDFFSSMEIAFLYAHKAGVFTAVSAGNFGSPPLSRSRADVAYSTLAHTAPWITVVAASTHDRQFFVDLSIGEKAPLVTLRGLSFRGDPGRKQRAIMMSTSATLRSLHRYSQYCIANSMDGKKVRDAIVVCLEGVSGTTDKARVVMNLGAAGMVVLNREDSGSIFPQLFPFPATHLTYQDGLILTQYINTAKRPRAFLSAATWKDGMEAPQIPFFSSTGPVDNPMKQTLLGNRNDLLKPDIAAPGVNVWAAWTGQFAPRATAANPVMVASGTSMASPHIAGIAALIRYRYPTWTPSAVYSAILTSASTVNNKGGPIRTMAGDAANPFHYGSGQVNPTSALDPGLVFEEEPDNFAAFLAGVSSDDAWKLLSTSFGWKDTIAPYDLNVPNIAVSAMTGTMVVARRLKNVYRTSSTYTSTVDTPLGFDVKVNPTSFFARPGEVVLVEMVITPLTPSNDFSFGSIVWSDGIHQVHSRLVLQAPMPGSPSPAPTPLPMET